MSTPSDHTIEINRRFHRDRLMDLIGHPPGWMLKSGMGMIGVLTCLLLFLSWMIHYPDIIEAPVVITSSNPPVQVYTNHSGLIDSIYVADGDTVVSGQILFYMANSARISDVINWKEWLEVVVGEVSPDSIFSPPPLNLQMGELHSAYSVVSQKYYEWYRWVNDQRTAEKIKAYKSEIETTGKLTRSMERQLSIYANELSLENKDNERQKSLLKSGVISSAAYEKSESTYLAAQRQKESMTTGILTQQMRVNQLESLIEDEKIAYQNQLNLLFTSLKELCREAISGVAKWQEQYVVEAKTNGIVSMPASLKAKNFIAEGNDLFAIIPVSAPSITYARANVPAAGLGRIEKGDKVLIRIDAWPYKQFGSIVAKVDQISLLSIPDDKDVKTFELLMVVTQPIRTNMGTPLTLRPEESGRGRVITKDRRILDRILNQFIQLTIKNN